MSPRTLEPELLAGHARANPITRYFVEFGAEDASMVIRRAADQFLANPPRLSESPAASLAADTAGALTLASSSTLVASRYNNDGTYQMGAPDLARVIKGVGWTPDRAFGRATLRSFTALIKRNTGGRDVDMQLQIYRATAQLDRGRWLPEIGADPEILTQQQMASWSFIPLLPEPAFARYVAQAWVSDLADVVFDLSPYRLNVGPGGGLIDVGGGTQLWDPDVYYFVVSPVNPPKFGMLEWRIDSTSSIDIAGVGRFQERTWSRPADLTNDPSGWSEQVFPYGEAFKLHVESYVPTSQAVYEVTLPAVPVADSLGRIVFETGVPIGASATLELSTAGSGGPWTLVKHGDPVVTKQLTYHLRLTLNATPDQRQTPRVSAFGIEFRIPVDVTAEAVVEHMRHEIDVPYCESAIGEGAVKVIRFGRRDHRDVGSDLAVTNPVSRLEADIYLGALHPLVPREKWFHEDRVLVSDRQPSATAETFGLLSRLRVMKKKVPQRAETISTVHTVTGSPTTTQVQVTPNLTGTTVGGHQYDGQNYWLRVRSSAVAGLAPDSWFVIGGNTSVDRLDFTEPLPGVFAAGDIIEVHSARYTIPVLAWVDADPADIWLELLNVHGLVPLEQIGRADLGSRGRSGYPPKVTDRAPGDAVTQAKLKVSNRLDKQEELGKLINQLSIIMGGATVEIGGQICFRQIYPLRDANGAPVGSPEQPAAIFDERDHVDLKTPTGLERRVTSLSCAYGIDPTSASKDQQPVQTEVYVDGPAATWLSLQDIEELAPPTVPAEISRWLYNTADRGKHLAKQITQQIVRAASTGLRRWPWRTVDAYPQLCVGDPVVVITDQYTDYDPSSKTQIRGRWAFPLVLTAVDDGGREFEGLMLGIAQQKQLQGGGGAEPGTVPAQPSINADFDAGGNLIVSLNMAKPAGGGFRVVATTPSVPSDAAVEAAAFVPGETARVNLGAGWASGAVVHVKAIAYASSDTAGAKSAASTADAIAPSASATPAVTSVSVSSINPGADTIVVAWIVANAPVGATYDLLWSSDNISTTTTIAGVTTPYTHNKLGAGGHGWDIVVPPGDVIEKIWYSVRMKDSGGTQVAQSGWISADVDRA